jgi:uncharacterized protein
MTSATGDMPRPSHGRGVNQDTPDGEHPPAGLGLLPANIMQFCRILRRAGIPVGPARMVAAVEAVEAVGVGNRRDFYWALHAALITRRDQHETFDEAFRLFWRDPDLLRRMMAMMLPEIDTGQKDREEANRRVSEAFGPPPRDRTSKGDEEEPPEVEMDARLTFSEREMLQSRDFEQMSAEELRRARELIARMRLPLDARPTRRFRPDRVGRRRIDPRATLRATMRGGGDAIALRYRRRATKPPTLVILCDISGSMSRYARVMLHFIHAVTQARHRVHSFVFGTRLSNITRLIRSRDVDEALARVGSDVLDWSGGTRIGSSLDTFNRQWGRRVLGQSAVVLLITDGLDRGGDDRLTPAMDRLHRSCARLIWLNPLLRFDGYEPRSQGAKVMVEHVDDLRTVHSLDSLRDLIDALSGADDNSARLATMRRWRALARS